MALGVGAASAHVRVDPASTSAGGFSRLTFRVPNESATAKTTGLAVTRPTATPFTSVSIKPMDGWTATITEANLPAPVTVEGATITKAAASVTWTADAAHQLGQHEYQTVSISVGRLPAAGTTPAYSTTPATPAPDYTLGMLGLGAGVLGLAAGSAVLVRTRPPAGADRTNRKVRPARC